MLVSCSPKPRKNVLLLSTMHQSKEIDEETKKPSVIMFYNSTKHRHLWSFVPRLYCSPPHQQMASKGFLLWRIKVQKMQWFYTVWTLKIKKCQEECFCMNCRSQWSNLCCKKGLLLQHFAEIYVPWFVIFWVSEMKEENVCHKKKDVTEDAAFVSARRTEKQNNIALLVTEQCAMSTEWSSAMSAWTKNWRFWWPWLR